MSYTSLSPVCVPDGLKNRRGYEGEFFLEELDTVSLPILMPTDIDRITATMSFPEFPGKDATGYIEATTDILENVKKGSPDVVWAPWSHGKCSTTAQDYVGPMTAIHLVRFDGTGRIKLTVRGQ